LIHHWLSALPPQPQPAFELHRHHQPAHRHQQTYVIDFMQLAGPPAWHQDVAKIFVAQAGPLDEARPPAVHPPYQGGAMQFAPLPHLESAIQGFQGFEGCYIDHLAVKQAEQAGLSQQVP
jgi:hypothetical protein